MDEPTGGTDDRSRPREGRPDDASEESSRRGESNEDRSRRRAAGVPVDGADPSAPDPRRDDAPVADEDEPDPPRIVSAVGSAGVYLAFVSLALTPIGIAGIYFGVQPIGNLATTFALVGVTIAMLLGMAHQAYTADVTDWG